MNASFPDLDDAERYVCVGSLFGTELRLPLFQYEGESYCNISLHDIPQNHHYKIGKCQQLSMACLAYRGCMG